MPDMILYNTTSNPKALNKDLTNSIEIQTINPYEPVSDLEGYVIVNYNSNYENMNYAKYDNDYYFIVDREKMIGGKMKLYLRMDVLMSFQTGIKNCDCVFERSENLFNNYIVDEKQPTSDTMTSNITLGSFEWDDTLTFITVG